MDARRTALPALALAALLAVGADARGGGGGTSSSSKGSSGSSGSFSSSSKPSSSGSSSFGSSSSSKPAGSSSSSSSYGGSSSSSGSGSTAFGTGAAIGASSSSSSSSRPGTGSSGYGTYGTGYGYYGGTYGPCPYGYTATSSSICVASSTVYTSSSSSGLPFSAILGIAIGSFVAFSIAVSVGIYFCLMPPQHRCCCRRPAAEPDVEEGDADGKPDAKSLPGYLADAVLPPGSQLPGSEHTSYENASHAEFRRAEAWYARRGLPDQPSSAHGSDLPGEGMLMRMERMNAEQPGSAWSFPLDSRASVSSEPNPSAPGILPAHVIAFPFPDYSSPEPTISRCEVSEQPLLPLRNPRLAYFEITPLALAFEGNGQPHTTAIALGLATNPYPEFRMPGWHAHSVGWHSDDGRLFVSDAFGGRVWQGPWGVGDVLGCGMLLNPGGSIKGFFFTRNGVLMRGEGGSDCYTMAEAMVPLLSEQQGMLGKTYRAAVGADGKAEVAVNFGEAPFAWAPANGDVEI